MYLRRQGSGSPPLTIPHNQAPEQASPEHDARREYPSGEDEDCKENNADFRRYLSKPPQICVRRGSSDSVTGGLKISFSKSLPPETPDIEKYYSQLDQNTPIPVIAGLNGCNGFPLQENRKRRRTVQSKVLNISDGINTESGSRFRSEFEHIVLIGRGSFSEVFKCRHRIDMAEYAIKRSASNARGSLNRQQMEKEVRILAELSNCNNRCSRIVQYFGCWTEEGRLFIQLELCGASVTDLIRTDGKFSEEQTNDVLVDIGVALEFCHENLIAHLDVKSDNIFICKDQRTFKLGDFGLAREGSYANGVLQVNSPVDILSGDARYLAREALASKLEDISKVDIFALGATALECVSGRALPAEGPDWHALRDASLVLSFLDRVSLNLKGLISAMLESRPGRRPTASDIIKAIRRQ